LTTYRLLLEYDGSRFSGWQVQKDRRTVQGELEAALARLFGRRVTTVGASRTDAGVHAEGQVASFLAPRPFRGDLAKALNYHLPDDVAVLRGERTKSAFHARNDAAGKTYRYLIVNRPVRPALGRDRSAWVGPPLDAARMRAAARRLVGRRDFSAFADHSTLDRTSPICRLTRLAVRRKGDEVSLEMTADRFLRNMARRLAGHLIGAGLSRGKAAKPPVARTAEAKGLTLVRVFYKRP
jgi:tRNA pseudouridine38-40 synthase